MFLDVAGVMESAAGAGGQEETEDRQQDGGDTSEVETEDCGATEPPGQQVRLSICDVFIPL